MSLKYLIALILFTISTTATTVADSIHLDLDVAALSSEECSDVLNCHDVNDINHSSKEDHSADHDKCHNSHVHLYIVSVPSKFIATETSNFIEFPDFNTSYLSYNPEIIKPPLVRA